MKKPIILLCAFILLINAVIGFLTFHSLKNAEKTAQYNQLQQKVHDSEKMIRLIEGQLTQTEEQLSAITQFLDMSNADNLTQLIDKTPIIQSLFVINHRQLIYPTLSEKKTQSEQQLIDLLAPLIHDPSLLLQRGVNYEGNQQSSGWYNAMSAHYPTLIYWQKIDENLIGYVLSYTVFRANLIANADGVQIAGHYKIFDNGQLLLSNRTQHSPVIVGDTTGDNPQIKVIRGFDYPLQHWTMDYVLPPPHVDYWSMILLALAVSIMLSLITLISYRYWQRRMRLAARQVQFVGQVSHELKTPLTNIRLYADLLAEQPQSTEQSARYATVISDESQRLTRLIQNVLNFTKSPVAQRQPIELNALLTRLTATFTPTLQAKGLTIRLNNQCSDNTVIHSDDDMLMQILSNFISNAEKYAADGKYIDVEASIKNRQCVISVRDYGKGIAKTDIKHLFKPFYRVHNHLTEGVSGTGIGLTIAKQLADTLGASLSIEPSSPGMRFSIILPI